MWSPPGVSDGALLALYRAWLVTFPIGMVSGLVGIAALAAGLARRPFTSGSTLCVLVVGGLVPVILRHCMPLLTAARLGYLTRGGVPVRPTEEPRRFWFWVAATAVPVTVEVAVAVYLVSVAYNLA